MLLKSGGFVLTGTIKRGHSRLWQKKPYQTQQNSSWENKEKKRYVFCTVISFVLLYWILIMIFIVVMKSLLFLNQETKMAIKSRTFNLFTKISHSQKRVVSISSTSRQAIVTKVAPIAVRKIRNLIIRNSWAESTWYLMLFFFFHLKAMFIYIVLFYVLYNDQSYLVCNFMPTRMSSVYLDNIVITHKKKPPTKHLLIKKGKTFRQVHCL